MGSAHARAVEEGNRPIHWRSDGGEVLLGVEG
jgi:hypothetical protein